MSIREGVHTVGFGFLLMAGVSCICLLSVFLEGCSQQDTQPIETRTELDIDVVKYRFGQYDFTSQNDRIECLKMLQEYVSTSQEIGQIRYSYQDMEYSYQIRNMIAIVQTYQSEFNGNNYDN